MTKFLIPKSTGEASSLTVKSTGSRRSPDLRNTLEQIKNIVKTNKIKAYLIGGAVRDILLGKKDFDLDIAVEGDSLLLGKLLQKKFGGKLILHSEFGTGTLRIKNSEFRIQRIDFANCRRERYSDFAKLPEVENCSLQEDLKRRDFTINTLALDLSRPGGSDLIDLFGGKRDIEDKKIRCLHGKSFMDDPTRIFRALRFAGRLDFTMEFETAQLMKKAIKEGFIQKLTPKRIRNEVILILQEPKRESILELMAKYGMLKIIGLKLPEPKVFKNIAQTISKFLVSPTLSSIQYWFVYLLGIIDFNNPPDCLELTKRENQKLKRIQRILDNIGQLKTACPSKIYKLLYGSEDEELVFIMSVIPKEREKIIKYMQEYSKVKIEITGRELSTLNLIQGGIKKGPLYKKVLTQILYAKLDGKVRNKEEEVRYLKNLKLDNIE